MDRDRLRSLLDQLTLALAPLIAQSITQAPILKGLPPAMGVLLRSMVDRQQIHSTISAAVTSIELLSDDECLALLRWIGAEIDAVTLDVPLDQPYLQLASEKRAAAAPAIAKLQQLLTR